MVPYCVVFSHHDATRIVVVEQIDPPPSLGHGGATVYTRGISQIRDASPVLLCHQV